MEYNTVEAFKLYVFYLAIKRHFTSSYDYFKYNGKVKANPRSFESRKDKFFFYKLSKNREARKIILSNLMVDPTKWIGDLLEPNAEQIYRDWAKRQQSLTYLFRTEIKELDEDFDSNFIVKNGQHPKALQLYNMNKISLETLTILMDLSKCFSHWEANISDTIVFPTINRLVKKSQPFIQYDRTKMRQILLDAYTDT